MARARRRESGSGSYSVAADGTHVWQLRLAGQPRVVRKARTKSDLRAKVAAVLDALAAGDPLSTPTVEQFAARWLDHLRARGRAAATLRQYEQQLRLAIVPALGALRLDAVKPAHVQAMLDALDLARGDDGQRQYSPATVGIVRRITASMFGHAVRMQLLRDSPVRHTETSAAASVTRSRHLTAEQFGQLIGHLQRDATTYGPLLLFLLGTGCRVSEALGLRLNRLAGDAVVIDTQLVWSTRPAGGGDAPWQLAPTKTRTARRLPLTDIARRAIALQAGLRAAHRVAAGTMYAETGLVFGTASGRPMTPRNVQRALDAALVRLGLPHFSLHDLRRTVATMIASVAQPQVAQAILGHASEATTRRHYIVALGDDIDRAAAALDEIAARDR
jgi:integrase